MKTFKKVFRYAGYVILFITIFNSFRIYLYSLEYSECKSDVAIVLGAGTSYGILSPVFKERVNHGIYLYKKKLITKIIFTGGIGKNQDVADSQIAKDYAIRKGVIPSDILIEKHSLYTHENLMEAKLIMDSLRFSTALIVSDPLHMKRSIELAYSAKILCEPSPTKTSMYQTTIPKLKFLMSETFFYTLGKITLRH
ncbi:MAG: YdcF family protein [Crocinitomicaceae bacterium]